MDHETLNNKIDLKDSILNKIRTGEVAMRPRYYFVLKVALLIFLLVVTFLVSVLILSYTFFSIQLGGEYFLLSFGSKGWYRFLIVFPWLLLLLNVGLLILVDSLLKRFRFAYNKPILYVFLGTLCTISVLGYLINFTSLHGNLLKKAEQKNLPFAGGFYDDLRNSREEDGIYRGVIVSIEGNTFLLESHGDGRVVTVIAPINANISKLYKEGDEVFVAGDIVADQIHAYGVRKFLPTD